jgi:hypothetical protein
MRSRVVGGCKKLVWLCLLFFSAGRGLVTLLSILYVTQEARRNCVGDICHGR